MRALCWMFGWMTGGVASAGPLDLRPAVDPLSVPTMHPLGGGPGPAPPPHTQDGWDVEHYDIEVVIDPSTRFVEVVQELRVVATQSSPGPLTLHGDTPVVLELAVNGTEADYTRDGDVFTVSMPSGPAEGEGFWVRVHHQPAGVDGDAFLGLQWGDPTWSMHQPYGARQWLVVYDEPGDPATLRWTVTAPSDQTVVTNGVLESVTDHEDGTTTWVRDFPWPISTYLFVLNVGTFEALSHDGPVPVTTYAPPDLVEAADETLGNTGDIVAWAEGAFGPYPWPHYTNVVVPLGGGMEHTTATSFGSGLVGDAWGEWVNVHEIAHHWWGDHVTCATWADIWLNEGFASYSEVLWAEELYGAEGRAAYLQDQRATYFYWQDFEGVSPVYDPPFKFGGTVYQKGSMVLHQLRIILGDEGFFAGLAAWGDGFGGGVATTEDLRGVLEGVYGDDLSWYFDDWIYRRGDPAYRYGVTTTERGGVVQLDLHVVQEGDETWRMVVPVTLELVGGEVQQELAWAEGAASVTSLCLDAAPEAVAFDPADELLAVSAIRDDGGLQAADWVCGGAEASEPGAGAEGARGCGCAGAPGPVGGLAALLGLVGLARRRR